MKQIMARSEHGIGNYKTRRFRCNQSAKQEELSLLSLKYVIFDDDIFFAMIHCLHPIRKKKRGRFSH